MSILLALLRSPRTPSSFRNRRENGTPPQYTEMGVFRRSNNDGLELQSYPSAPAASVSSLTDTADLGSSYSVSSDSAVYQQPLGGPDITGSVSPPPPVEVSFALNFVTPGIPNTVNGLVKDTFERLCWSGYVLCKLLSSSLPGSLDERAINSSEDGADITSEDALENFQLCYSCAQAQGCDVQHFAVESLLDCEVAALTDFVLEVLRVCVIQEIPVGDRHWLIPPTQSPAASSITRGATAATAASTTHPHIANPNSKVFNTSQQQQRQQQSDPAHPHLWARVGSRSYSNAIRDDGKGQGHGSDRFSSGVPLQGSAAARRAAAGLERWVLQLPAPDASDRLPATAVVTTTEDSSSAAAANIEPVSRRGDRGGSVDHESPATTSPLPAAAGGGRSPHEAQQQQDSAKVGRLEATFETQEDDDALNLESWERLVRFLTSRNPLAPPIGLGARQEAGHATAPLSDSAAATGTSEPHTAGNATAAAHAMALAAAVTATPAVAVTSAGVTSACCGLSDEEQRWTAAAVALSQALARWVPRCSSSSSGGDDATRTQGDTGTLVSSSMPPLGPEHLRCRHPGLRSLLLASALLAACRLRDAPAAAASITTAVRTATASAGDVISISGARCDSFLSGGSSNVIELPPPVVDTVTAATTNGAKPPPASPAPPLPPLQPPQQHSGWRAATGCGGRGSSRSAGGHSGSGRSDGRQDVLSEHNKLVQREHEQRALRRQMMMLSSAGSGGWEVGGGGGGGGGERGRGGGGGDAPATMGGMGTVAGLFGGGGRVEDGSGSGSLWAGDGEDLEGEDQEERVLRLWLNSLDARIHVGSLFAMEVTTGWPLLLALDAIHPGCVNWADAFKPPFKEKVRKILSVQNCNLVIEVCTRQLAMPPLVNIGGLDLALGQRRATLSLVFQMMRHHMGMLLGLVTPPPPLPSPSSATPPPTSSVATERGSETTPSSALSQTHSYPPSITPTSCGGPQHYQQKQQHKAMTSLSATNSLTRPPGLSPGRGVSVMSHTQPLTPPHYHPHQQQQQQQRRAYVEVEKAVLAWANAKLSAAAAAATAAAAAGVASPTSAVASGDGHGGSAGSSGNGGGGEVVFVPLASFSDPRLGEGRLLLQLLASICPRTVNPKYVLQGRTPEERGSNAKYLLSCARKVGCVIFLAWEDVIAARPNLLLLLMASFMALDRKRTAAAAAAVANATGPAEAITAGAEITKHGSRPSGGGGHVATVVDVGISSVAGAWTTGAAGATPALLPSSAAGKPRMFSTA